MNDDSLANAISDKWLPASNGTRIDRLEDRALVVDGEILGNYHETEVLKSQVRALTGRVRGLAVALGFTAVLVVSEATWLVLKAVTAS